jgi:hypothetical protein
MTDGKIGMDLDLNLEPKRKKGPKGPRSAGTDRSFCEEALKTRFKKQAEVSRAELVEYLSQSANREFALQQAWSKDVETKKHGTMPALLPKASRGSYKNPFYTPSDAVETVPQPSTVETVVTVEVAQTTSGPTETAQEQPQNHANGTITGLTVELIGKDGNAFAIMGAVQKAMRRANVSSDIIQRYMSEATAGDYDHLLLTTAKYVNVE